MPITFISPLDDDIVKGLYGDRNNLANTAALLRGALDIPPEEYDRLTLVDPSLRRRWKRRGEKGKLGILDFLLLTAAGKNVNVEVQIRRYKLMIPRLVFYNSTMITDQMGAGFNYDQIRQTITLVIADHVLLPEEAGYLNTYELRNRESGRLFTDLQQYVIVELPKLPEQDDGKALWPHLRFMKCRGEEEMAMLAEEYPEVRPLVAEYKRMTFVERLRKRAEYREKQRRDEWAALEYMKDEGREQGRAEGMEQGRAEGMEQGRAEGMEQGRAEGQNQILELMKQGYTTEQIEAKLAGDTNSRRV
jgi:predicted transposase/invertase (TIGR01784 family)